MLTAPQEHRLHRLRRGTAEINVVPFIDITLVLLIVFMVGAPLAAQGVAVQLPATRTSNLGVGASSPLVINIARDGSYSMSLDGEESGVRDLAELSRHLQILTRRGRASTVVVRADEAVSYRAVAQLLAEVRAAGVGNVGLATRAAQPIPTLLPAAAAEADAPTGAGATESSP